MAGTEKNGFEASSDTLFDSASFILTPRDGEDECLMQKIQKIILAAGFKKVVVTTPQHHDRMIAFTSQLPHVIACAYVSSPSCPEHNGYSAGSFRDVSRVANINAGLWSELFAFNREALCEEIDDMIDSMKLIRDAAFSGSVEELAILLQKTREIKEKYD